MARETITYEGIPLRCEFSYYRGCPASLSGPAEPEAAELDAVEVKGVDIFPLLSREALEGIEQACIERHHELRDEARLDALLDWMEG